MLHPKLRDDLRLQIKAIGPFSQLKDKLLVVKVGSPEKPASANDLSEISSMLSDLLKGSDLNVMVTHHEVEFNVLPETALIMEPKKEEINGPVPTAN